MRKKVARVGCNCNGSDNGMLLSEVVFACLRVEEGKGKERKEVRKGKKGEKEQRAKEEMESWSM
jgi:hypothetical protein